MNNKKEYKEQDGCHNCSFVFIKVDYDDDEYYCMFGVDNRPLCMSVYLHESPDYVNNKQMQKAYDDWDNWKEDKQVNSYGICNFYRKNK